jgi:putative Mn2+ efflux pump MntP
MFLGVDWGAFVVVFLVALAATVVVVIFFSVGLRLLSNGELEGSPTGAAVGRPLSRTLGGWASVAVGVVAVLYGLYLVIPQFHGG